MTKLISADGSPVDAYAALPAEPELSAVRKLIAGRRTVLDLGCGTGRIADPLVDAGHDVVAVDESLDMLSWVRRARTVHGSIEELNLEDTFDAVLLLSHLINSENAPELLSAAARHLADGALLVAQRLEPGRSWQPGSAQIGPVSIELADVVVERPRIAGTTTYVLDGRSWAQPWVMWEWTDEDLADLLAAAGLRLLATDGPWVTATPT